MRALPEQEIFQTKLVEGGFIFSGFECPPPKLSVQLIAEFVSNNLPPERAEMFFLNASCDHSLMQRDTAAFLADFTSFGKPEAGSFDANSVADVAKVILDDVLEKLPQPLDPEEYAALALSPKGLDAFVILIRNEMYLHNGIVRRVAESLSELDRAMKGDIMMTSEFESLLHNMVRSAWTPAHSG